MKKFSCYSVYTIRSSKDRLLLQTDEQTIEAPDAIMAALIALENVRNLAKSRKIVSVKIIVD